MFKLIVIFLCFIVTLNSKGLEAIDVDSFYHLNPSVEREKIIHFITKQFKFYSNRYLSQERVEKIWADKYLRNKLKLMRFQIVKQNLYADSFDISHLYFVTFLSYLAELVKKYHIQDVDFLVIASDEMPYYGRCFYFPVFMFSKDTKNVFEKNVLLMPDSHMISKKWSQLSKDIMAVSNSNTLWQNKINKIFWRGAPSGGRYILENIPSLTRFKLIILAKLFPEMIDANLVLMPGDKFMNKILSSLSPNAAGNVKEVDHLIYKYLISVDGYTCAWLRVPWIMLSNSVLFKQDTSKMEWFYPAMLPNWHYVPIREDLSDLYHVYNWSANNDFLMQKISLNATNFVKENLLPEHIEAHMVIILNEYAKMHQGSNIKATLKLADDVYNLYSLAQILFNRIKKNLMSYVFKDND